MLCTCENENERKSETLFAGHCQEEVAHASASEGNLLNTTVKAWWRRVHVYARRIALGRTLISNGTYKWHACMNKTNRDEQ